LLYTGHPAIPDVYYTIASFHRMAFEHKFAEAISLLMHLGATEITVEYVRGWSREFARQLSIPLTEIKVDGKLSSTTARTSSLLYEATFKGNTHPTLPATLVWFHMSQPGNQLQKGGFLSV
jgi:hypothetical protein